MLQETFIKLISKYTQNNHLQQELWNEIEENYSHKKRHYHTLKHLENLLLQLMPVKDKIEDWDAILFCLYYHDVIYNASQSNNEERSAELAENRMRQCAVPVPIIERCQAHILATKSHVNASDADTNYFTDADLSVLGQPWEIYSEYYKNVRKEYSMFPDFMYNPGRKKVLSHFLGMERIFKTDYFYNHFELQAKENVKRELELL